MAVSGANPDVMVLTLRAVRWAIGELKSSKVHPFFLAYLHLRRHTEFAGSSRVTPAWDELGDFLRVKGGPPNKPYFRPFWNGNVEDASRYWLNANIAGSYAPSSLRTVPRTVIDTDGAEFILLEGHAQRARHNLLYDTRISAVATAAFFFRDYGFLPDDPTAQPADLLAPLIRDFRLSNDDFDLLFHSDVPSNISDWFETLVDDTVGVE